jgi:uncharacterized membrane protein
MEPPPGDAANPELTRDEIIDSYVKILAHVLGRYVSGSISFQLVLLVIVWCVSSGKWGALICNIV